MLYLGIDQHKRQLTVNLRSEDGSVILQRQKREKEKKEKVLVPRSLEKEYNAHEVS